MIFSVNFAEPLKKSGPFLTIPDLIRNCLGQNLVQLFQGALREDPCPPLVAIVLFACAPALHKFCDSCWESGCLMKLMMVTDILDKCYGLDFKIVHQASGFNNRQRFRLRYL